MQRFYINYIYKKEINHITFKQLQLKKLKVVELFAGVGGFRIGLEKTSKFEVIWSNQWEPSTVKQHASLVYERYESNKKVLPGGK